MSAVEALGSKIPVMSTETRSSPSIVNLTTPSELKFNTSCPIVMSPSYPLIVRVPISDALIDPPLSPDNPVIVCEAGPSIVKFKISSSPSRSVSVSAVISITPPSSTPKERLECGDLGSEVK